MVFTHILERQRPVGKRCHTSAGICCDCRLEEAERKRKADLAAAQEAARQKAAAAAAEQRRLAEERKVRLLS